VITASSGRPLLTADGLDTLRRELLPLVDWITPNLRELAALVETAVVSASDAEAAIHSVAHSFPHLNIVVTGGDLDDATATDRLLTADGQWHTFIGERIHSNATHGTGCAFSSALLARLVLGDGPEPGVAAAKRFVSEAIRSAPGIGHGKGPLNLKSTQVGQVPREESHKSLS